MKFLCLLLLTVWVNHPLFTRSEQIPPKTKKVLLIGIDGLQYEKLKALSTPNFDSFKIVKAYTGGIVGTPSQQTTGSGPGWMTVLTGVWNEQHGVISNDTINKVKSKTVFQYLKESNPQLKTTSIATWSPIHDFLDKQMQYVDQRYDGGTDEAATQKVLHELENSGPDFMFLHYSDPDVIGHNVGYGEKYDQSILTMDSYLGKIMAVVNRRTKEKNEEWLVILTTDHGRRGDGHHHGSQTIEEKTVFVGMNLAGNAEFNGTVSDLPNQDFNGIYKHIPQTSVLPTILSYFNIKINSSWQLSSPSLIGKLGPRRVMLDAKEDVLHWYSGNAGSAKIYKDKHLISTVPAKKGRYLLNEKMHDHPVNYTIMIDGQSGSVTRNNFRIVAATNWGSNNRALFLFSDNTYSLYKKDNNRPETGYPKNLPGNLFPNGQNFLRKAEAIVNLEDSKMILFLNDGRFINCNSNSNDAVSTHPKEITNSSWPGLEPYKNEIIGAVKMTEAKIRFFTRDGRYIVFDIKANKTETTYALPITEKTLPGLAPYASQISTAWDQSPEFFYIFLKDNSYLKYDKINNKMAIGYPRPVNNDTWPGLTNQ